MKKSLLLIAMGLLCTVASVQVKAQAIAYVGPRLLITTQTPSALEGVKDFTWSSDPAITGPWGRTIDSIWNHVPLQMVSMTDTIACGGALPANSLAGKWALIWRADCEFGAKAKKAQDAGAVGVIIVNNVAGAGPVNMAAGAAGNGVTIPTLMVSNPDGNAIDAMVHSANQVYVTLTPYGFGNAHDLCIPNQLYALAPGYAMPKDQLDTATNGKPKAYQGYLSGWVANTGTSDETNVKLKLNVDWTPTAGSPVLFHKDSIAIAGTFAALDSLDLVNSTTAAFNLHATTTGTFDFTYSASCANVDQQPIDNMQKFSMYVTDHAFCRGQYNNVAGEPIVMGGLRLGGTTPPLNMTWGSLFYVAKATTAYNIQTALYPDDTTEHDLSFIENTPGSFYTAIFKWVDANSDGVIDGPELTLAGTGGHHFSIFDLPGKVFVAPFDAPVALEAGAWYWSAVVMSNTTLFLGVDNKSNYYNRLFATSHLATGAWRDYWAPLYGDGINTTAPYLNAGDTTQMVPFAVDKALPFKPTDSMSLALGANTPAIALNTVALPDGVKKVSIRENSFTVFPNPATDNINVSVDFPVSVSNVTFDVMNAMGQVISRQNKGTIKNTTFSLPTKGLPAGNYYIIMNADGRTTFRAVTIASK